MSIPKLVKTVKTTLQFVALLALVGAGLMSREVAVAGVPATLLAGELAIALVALLAGFGTLEQIEPRKRPTYILAMMTLVIGSELVLNAMIFLHSWPPGPR